MTILGHCQTISHVTFVVGNAKATAQLFALSYGFEPFKYRGLETGDRLYASHAVRLNDIILVFKSPLTGDETDLLNQHLVKHGDAVKDVAFNVDDLDMMLKHIDNSGGDVVKMWTESDKHGQVRMAIVETPNGDVTHTLVERKGYPEDEFLPNWKASPLQYLTRPQVVWSKFEPIGLRFIDHVAVNQIDGQMEPVAKWYEETLRFHRFWSVDDRVIQTGLTGLRSVFVANQRDTVMMPINEPGSGRGKSQIQEFIEYNNGPGVQHIAFATDDICQAVRRLKERGVEFLSTPSVYYQRLRQRLKESPIDIKSDLATLEQHQVLVDFDENGYLLQIFTKPIQDRPTLFFELIERHNFSGFGAGNIKALFEAIEADQKKRGNI